MKIGFEAKRAFTNGTGLGHYSRTLISSLASFFPEHDYFLFSPKQTSLFNTQSYQNIHTITPTTFPSTLLKSVWRSNWVKKDLQKFNIDVYHGLSHEIPINIQTTKIKTVVTIHDLIFERYPKQYKPIDVAIYRKKFFYACKNANRIIAVSEQTKNDIVEFYKISPDKIDVCYQSCNPAFAVEVSLEEKERIKNYYQLPDKFFLYVGSIIERKNLLMLCMAYKLFCKNSSQTIPLVVIGNGGSYKQQVKKYIAENNLEQNIIFLSEKFNNQSFSTAADFPAIYQQALALIYPSIFEGFGIPVLEALWSKTPVITSNISCMPETGGNAALYANPFNQQELANALINVATNANLRNEMIEKGIQHAQKFSAFNCANEVMKVYKKL